jgi:hypothetical protein
MVRATYTFQTTNENIAGGLIHISQTGLNDLCLDAGSASPAVGDYVRMQRCSQGSPEQHFAYTANLNLVLVSTRTPVDPGLCLEAPPPALLTPITYLVFARCADPVVPRQQWSFNDSSNFQGTTDGVNLSSPAFCLNVQTPDLPGSLVVAQRSCGGGYNNVRTWSIEAPVGAGAARATTGQVVNFNQFGRCMDITEFRLDHPYHIVWPCKQAPNGAVAWNQRWELPPVVDSTPGTGYVITRPPAGAHCLVSPRSVLRGTYVVVRPCPGVRPPEMTWTRYEQHDDIKFSYTIRDVDGYCLSPTDQNASSPDLYPHGQAVSKMIVARCDGTTLQKWNAPPNIGQSIPLKDITER